LVEATYLLGQGGGLPTRSHDDRKKKAVSPLISSIILIGIVIVVGGAAWTYANTAVGARLDAQGSEVANDVNSVKEKFAIVGVKVERGVFPSPLQDNVTIWIYNNGGVDTTISEIWISNSNSFGSAVDSSQYLPSTPWRGVGLSPGELKQIAFRVPDTSDWDEVHIKVLGQCGRVIVYTYGCIGSASVC
jgi:flagellin-like protein